MRRWPVVALAALSIVACGAPPSSGTPTPIVSPPAQALVAWEAFPADQVPRPVVLIGNASPQEGFSDTAAKIAASCHKFKAGITLSKVVPAAAQATWTTGTTGTYPALSAAAAFAAMSRPPAEPSDPSCAIVSALVLDGSRFGVFGFQTDRGIAQVSAWLFTASGVIGEVAYPGLAESAFWNGGLASGSLNNGSTVSADGWELTVSFWGSPAGSGPCSAEYRGVVAESHAAVAVAVHMIPKPSPSEPVACPAIAQQRSVTVTLASPLGGRVVVDSSGAAVSVCPASKPDC